MFLRSIHVAACILQLHSSLYIHLPLRNTWAILRLCYYDNCSVQVSEHSCTSHFVALYVFNSQGKYLGVDFLGHRASVCLDLNKL